MGRKATMSARGGRLRWIVLAGIAALGCAGWSAHQQASAFATRTLDHAFPGADARMGRVWFDPDGDIVASKVAVYLSTPDPGAPDDNANTLRFDTLRVHAPGGWLFYAHNLLDPRLAKANVAEWSYEFEGFDTSTGHEPTLGTLGPVGALSASPFESEGCASHANFARSDLAAMRLDIGRTTFETTMREHDSTISTRIVLATPGASRLEYTREETLAAPTSLLALGKTATSTTAERWEVSDQGFVKARNAFCAKADGVEQGAFLARHLLSVKRLLETRGLVADASTLAAYQDFAQNGGALTFGGTYETPLHSSERAQARDNGSALLRMAATFEHGSMKSNVAWSGTTPRPLASNEGATFAAITRENGGVMPTPRSVPASQPTLVATALVADAQPHYASSLPTPPSPARAPGGRLAWEDLGAMQGRLIQIFTVHNPPRTATLVSVDAKEAHVLARVAGGQADYRISREAFLRATLIE